MDFLDLAVSHGSGIVSFIMGNSVVAPPAQQVGHASIGIIGVDVNGDGWMDIATANSNAGSVSILVNDKRGSFSKEVRYPVPVDSRSLVAADFDGDKVVDLAVASWGEGTVSVLKGNGDGTFQAQKTFQAGSGPASIITVDGNHDGVLDIAVANRYSYDVTLLFNDMLSLSQDGPVDEGSPVTVSFGNPSDLSPADSVAGFRYAFAVDPAQLPARYADAGLASSGQFTFADNGTPTYYGRIFDKDNGYTDYRTVVTVNKVAPSQPVLHLSAATLPENGTAVLSGSFTDPGALDTHTVQIEWGDDSTPTTLELAAGVTSIPDTTHQYLDNRLGGVSYPITVSVTDKDGYVSPLATIDVTVTNVPPSEVELDVSVSLIDKVGSMTLSGSFTDPGVLDTHTVQIEWGDGSTPTTLNLAAGVTSIPVTTHQYPDNPYGQPNDSFPISVTVVDKDGGSAIASAQAFPYLPDLALTSLSAPDKAEVDEVVQLQWTVANVSDYPAVGHWMDGVYLSSDTTLDASDWPLVEHDSAGVAPLQPQGVSPNEYKRTYPVTIPSHVSSGNYYLIAKTDAWDGLRKTAKRTTSR